MAGQVALDMTDHVDAGFHGQGTIDKGADTAHQKNGEDGQADGTELAGLAGDKDIIEHRF